MLNVDAKRTIKDKSIVDVKAYYYPTAHVQLKRQKHEINQVLASAANTSSLVKNLQRSSFNDSKNINRKDIRTQKY